MPADDEDNFDKFEDRQDALFDDLLGDEDDAPKDPPEPEVKDDEVVVDEPEPEPEPEKVKEEGDEDYDAPVVKEKEPEEPTDPAERETIARQQLKEIGPKLKAEMARAKELELSVERERARADEAERRAAETQRIRVKPMEDPEYRKLHDGILTDVQEESELLPAARNVPKHFGEFATDYLAARKSDDREKAIGDLKAKIIGKCIIGEVPYDELDEVEREKADATAAGVLKILRNSADKVQQALDLAGKLTEEGESGEINLRSRDYDRTVGGIKPVVEGLGELADDLIEANPYAVESVVAKMVKESSEAKRRSDSVKRDIQEVFVGPRPLTPDEVRKLKTEGTDLKAFEAERRKAYESKKNKFISFLYHGVMTRGELPGILKELAELKGTKDAEDSEKDALREVLRKKPGAPKVEDKKVMVPAGKRPNTALNSMLGDPDDYDDGY